MSSAASARQHRGQVRAAGTEPGAMPKWRAHSTCISATDVRELVSSAIVRTSARSARA